ncbi:MAG TPA: DUF5668 domain-containing protein [Pseudacidobacterium sp.]|jgi:hypothetical protein|nr:DUF5668 domain-containing protein [Pseudacidobacterium sp.]
MNQYIFLQRITGPAMVLTFGVTALLDQWHILQFGKSWPLYLIVLGVLKLAQRAALANAEPPAYPPYAGYPPATPAGSASGSTALVPSGDSSIEHGSNSGEER